MTVVPITGERIAAQFKDAGRYVAAALRALLFAVGWVLAKSCRAVATALAALLFGAGWFAARVVWPALRWSGDAVKLGWQQGRMAGLAPSTKP